VDDKLSSRMSNWSVVLMSVAALATSWASYQASLWSGEQAHHNAAAAAYRVKSTSAATHAGQLRMVDVSLFMNWVSAESRGDTMLARFVSQRFRHEFVPAFSAWRDTRPLESSDAPASPFTLPSYRLRDDSVATHFERIADEAAAAGQFANGVSDSYVLDAVILATVMFFAGGPNQGSHLKRRLFMLVVAGGMCLAGVVRLFMAPRA
jgi:hypothetical protein